MTDVDFTRAAFGHTGLSFKTLSVIIEESNTSQIDEVIFLYRRVDGMARESHGYYIAEKAGVSEKIVVRAHEPVDRVTESGTAQSGLQSNLVGRPQVRARDVAKSLRENLPVRTPEHQENSILRQYCQVTKRLRICFSALLTPHEA